MDDTPYFMQVIDGAVQRDDIWELTLLGGRFVGTIAWCQRDINGIPIMVSLEQKNGKIVEIPWTAIQCITYEGTKNG